MVLAMSRPFPHPKTGVYWLRKRVPADLVEKIGKEVERFSLRTKDPSEAKRRYADEIAKLERRWAAVRNGTVASTQTDLPAIEQATLSEREAHELAAAVHDWWLANYAENPSEQRSWPTDRFSQLWKGDQGVSSEASLISESDRPLEPGWSLKSITGRAIVEAQATERVETWCLAQANLLLANRKQVDDPSRLKLGKAVAAAMQSASLTLEQFARGGANRPIATTSEAAPRSAVTLETLFDGWLAERQPAKKTAYEWRRVVGEFQAFLGHQEAHRITTEDVVGWKQALVAQGLLPRTIRYAKLAAISAILRWGVNNHHLRSNPVEGVTIEVKARAGHGRRSFTDQEAELLLTAAAKETDPVRHWVPWLCAYTGARVSEICQLRAEDVREIEGIWSLRIDPEAGPLKNRSSERTIPLHAALIDSGFLSFAETVENGPLFAALPPDKFGKRGGNGTKVIGRWVRSLGLSDLRLSPSHSWRHRLKTSARRYGLPPDIVDAITGHTPRSVGDSYGEFPIAALKREIDKLPAMTG